LRATQLDLVTICEHKNNLFQAELARFVDVVMLDKLVQTGVFHEEVVGIFQDNSDKDRPVEEE